MKGKRIMSAERLLWKKIIMICLTAVLAACSVVGCSSSGDSKKDSKGEVTMIDFTGVGKTDVEDWINENGVDRDKVLYSWAYSETVQEGIVISQSIPAGQQLGDDTLTITVSKGPDPETEINLIDFTGMSVDDIQKWFMNEHFQHVSIEYVYDPSLTPGTFISTSVTDGKALRTEPIVVKIAGDPDQAGVGVDVPDMSGWPRSQCEQWANTNQITIDYTLQLSDSVPVNTVISFTPSAGSEIVKGDHMSVVISGGSQIQAVDLTGRSQTDIDAWGQQNGVTISYIQCWNAAPSGTVYWNQPNSGTMRMGDIMNVYISVGPVPVQSYVGASYQNNFLGWLNSINSQYNSTANLQVSVSEQETPDYDSGVIISQSPDSGYINPNDTITLVVAKHTDPAPTPAPTVTIPSMTGYSENDFLNALSGYGVSAGNRTEQYSKALAQGYIISNDTGQYNPGATINYIVSLGKFTVIPQYWAGKDYGELQNYIDSANRMGANVNLDVVYEATNDAAAHNKVHNIQGPADDGEIDVWVWRLNLMGGN